nr:hypothetical protein [Gloeobacter morelensis]
MPMMYRAQVRGRCQLQYVGQGYAESDIRQWLYEWTAQAERHYSGFGEGIQTRSYQIAWRFVTNGGQDEGIIRPVLGARGWPYYPGSSMKGAFRNACTPEQAVHYCGSPAGQKELSPGLLRFHGGYPTDAHWLNNLVDVIHPQQAWQVESQSDHSAFAGISLYRPELSFGISSSEPLTEEEWKIVWEIWEKALANGLGSRVSAGYGQIETAQSSTDTLYKVSLRGQGVASKLLDGTAEFRDNLFKAALRGNTLRLLGGLLGEAEAKKRVEELWGGLGSGRNGPIVGLLGSTFLAEVCEVDSFGKGKFELPVYEVEGELRLTAVRNLKDDQRQQLKKLCQSLLIFTMLLGGFGKSWRRVDHRLFYQQYLQNKPMIGCHWQFAEPPANKLLVPINGPKNLHSIGSAIDYVRDAFRNWLKIKEEIQNPPQWREAWHSQKVQVWARIADNQQDSRAVQWFHGPYSGEATIKGSILTGKINQIGRIWHRMYPRYTSQENQQKQREPELTKGFVEILTIFPDGSEVSNQFLEFLSTPGSDFKKVWPLS